jgi:hypothetical protein
MSQGKGKEAINDVVNQAVHLAAGTGRFKQSIMALHTPGHHDGSPHSLEQSVIWPRISKETRSAASGRHHCCEGRQEAGGGGASQRPSMSLDESSRSASVQSGRRGDDSITWRSFERPLEPGEMFSCIRLEAGPCQVVIAKGSACDGKALKIGMFLVKQSSQSAGMAGGVAKFPVNSVDAIIPKRPLS